MAGTVALFEDSQSGRFVILYHELPESDERASHWDLMLERADALETWAMNGLITEQESVMATKLTPHRKEYLTYEGQVSNNRGIVTRVAAGTYQIVKAQPKQIDLELIIGQDRRTIRLAEIDSTHWKMNQL